MSSEYFLLFLLSLFVIGAIAIHIISRKKERPDKINAWKKFFVYFFIIQGIFLCVIFVPVLFKAICVLVAVGGGTELFRLQIGGFGSAQPPVSDVAQPPVVERSRNVRWPRFCLYFTAYLIFATLFVFFSFQSVELLILTLFAVCMFDAFSQLSGQLFGKRKIAPVISPNKTLGGLIGGTIMAVLMGIIANYHSGFGLPLVIILILAVIAASFAGDLLASYVKRQYGVKDYSSLLPGHGGILDRFDSLIVAGAVIVLINFIWL